MHDDIQEAKEICYKLIDERVGTVNEPADYVLVPFSDPGYGPVYKTTDPEEFRAAISNLTADGGGDCPELSMTGIELAILNSLPGSEVFVFTDADAKDINKTDDVIALGQARKTKVTNFFTSERGCSRRRRSTDGQSNANAIVPMTKQRPRRRRSLDAYERIATATGGLVLQVTKVELSTATEIINLSFEGAEVTILIVDVIGRSSVTFPVDNTVSKIEISVSTTDKSLSRISYDVTGPDGLLRNDITEVVNTGRQLVLVTNLIDIGEWRLNFYDYNSLHIVVNATSQIDFLYTFYSEDDTGQLVPFFGSRR
ncbi:von Willebrand factor A domain-containing protein 7-like [Ptychodera flava]|uniref:von Willebrand factor A domain-containing protein 7-like n=1 Tax=Ptychodera flava TaxID=63121 RepID=UPI003969C08B